MAGAGGGNVVGVPVVTVDESRIGILNAAGRVVGNAAGCLLGVVQLAAGTVGLDAGLGRVVFVRRTGKGVRFAGARRETRSRSSDRA